VNSAVKNIIFWVVMAVTALLIWAVVKSSTGERVADLTFTELVTRVNKDEIKDVTIAGTDVTGTFKKDNSHFRSTIPANYPDLYKTLQDKNVNTVIKDNSGNSWMPMVCP
jgi:cell division protease FtsH